MLHSALAIQRAGAEVSRQGRYAVALILLSWALLFLWGYGGVPVELNITAGVVRRGARPRRARR